MQDGVLRPAEIWTTRLKTTWSCWLSTRRISRHREKRYRTIWTPNQGPPPLLTRGWSTQETVLPIRKLRLTGNEIIWVYNDGFQCECGHWEWDSDKDNEAECPWIQRQYKPSFYNLKTDFMSNLVELGYDKWSPYEDWRYVITLFSGTKLTYERDTLSAVSGLAQVVQRATERLNGVPDRYLAGLWEKDLARGLAWTLLHSSHVDVKHKRPSTYRAPSWSWASLDGPITWFMGANVVLGGDYEVRNGLTVSEAHCNALSPFDLTGQVSSGFIVLTGHVAPVQLVRKGETGYKGVWDIIDKNFEVVRFSCDFSEEISSQDLDSASARYSSSEDEYQYCCLKLATINVPDYRAEMILKPPF